MPSGMKRAYLLGSDKLNIIFIYELGKLYSPNFARLHNSVDGRSKESVGGSYQGKQ